MELENRPREDEKKSARPESGPSEPGNLRTQEPPDPSWIFVGEHGLRAGWSAAIGVGLYYLLITVLDTVALSVYPRLGEYRFTPLRALIGEFLPFLAILSSVLIVAQVEGRSLRDYNLRDSRRLRHFGTGFVAGFVALSALVLTMFLGGWLHFGRVGLNGAHALKYACVWGVTFLLVGFCEEGGFRCFLQATLTRGINFWWAVAAVGAVCILLQLKSAPQGAGGVYVVALLGVIPCWLLERGGAPNAGFWQAAWVTSTTFGFYHTGNNGETWIGIFAASLIGFIFCVSVWVTGSAWWAIGCHMAWDWTETFFYGTADSGFPAQGHFLTTMTHGNALWSGGADGPEGSLLVLPTTLLLLVLLLAYRRRNPASIVAGSAEPLAN